MFQFTRFPPLRVTRCDPRRVSPFGHFRLMRLHTAHRNFSQCTTSFFGTLCPGIPRMLLLTFATCDTEKLILSRSCFFCFLVLFVWYSIGKLHPEFLGFRLTPAAVWQTALPVCPHPPISALLLRSSFLRQKQPGTSPRLSSTRHSLSVPYSPYSVGTTLCSLFKWSTVPSVFLTTTAYFNGFLTVCLLPLTPGK